MRKVIGFITYIGEEQKIPVSSYSHFKDIYEDYVARCPNHYWCITKLP
jgi:hypothetical protein